MARTQMQLSTNRRMLTPSDDPIASARALEVTQSQSVNAQYATNRQNARSSLSQVEAALASATVADPGRADAGGRGRQRRAARKPTASRSPPNSKAAWKTCWAWPTAPTAPAATCSPATSRHHSRSPRPPAAPTYHGDQGQRELQVGASRKLAISDSGSVDFRKQPDRQRHASQTAAAAANTGTGVISSGAVGRQQPADRRTTTRSTSASAGTPAVTTYTVTDISTGAAVRRRRAQPYRERQADRLRRHDVRHHGRSRPTATSSRSSRAEKQSVFTTLTDLIDTLRAAGDRRRRPRRADATGCNTASENLDSRARQRADGARLGRLAHEGTRLPRQRRRRPRHPVRRDAVAPAGPRHGQGDLRVHAAADDARSGAEIVQGACPACRCSTTSNPQSGQIRPPNFPATLRLKSGTDHRFSKHFASCHPLN